MITFNEQNRIFRLDTPATSYAMGVVEGGYLGHLYYGPRIGGTDLEQLYRLDAAALPSVWPGQKGCLCGRLLYNKCAEWVLLCNHRYLWYDITR